ncbi:MAG: anti-sigma factor family protein [Pyrinomonadaceae bacterium]
MKCKEITSELEHYADGELTPETTADVEMHLDSCPVCRAELSHIQEFRTELRSLAAARVSLKTMSDLRAAVASHFAPAYGYPSFALIEGNVSWRQKWFFPTAIGTLASLVFGISLLVVILMPSNFPSIAFDTEANSENSDSLLLANLDPNTSGVLLITPQQFAHSRAEVSHDSPSLNPAGQLAQLAGSDARDDEVVVVADVYGNGSAAIADIVESPRDRKMMDRLVAALRPNMQGMPFVPARMDNRGNIVRVVLKFQNVNVNIDDAAEFR